MKTVLTLSAFMAAIAVPVMAGGGAGSQLCMSSGFVPGTVAYTSCVSQIGGGDPQSGLSQMDEVRVSIKNKHDKGKAMDGAIGDLSAVTAGHDNIPVYALPEFRPGLDLYSGMDVQSPGHDSGPTPSFPVHAPPLPVPGGMASLPMMPSAPSMPTPPTMPFSQASIWNW